MLPALFPGDSELDYHNLDERCQNGGDAMNIFPRLQQLEQSLPKQGMLSQDGKLSMVDSLMPISEQIRILEEINASRQAQHRFVLSRGCLCIGHTKRRIGKDLINYDSQADL